MKVLLVDDEEDLRKILSRALVRRCGVEIVEANSGKRALEVLASDPKIELVISDYNMAEGTGGQLFQQMLASGSRVPFVLHSSAPAETFSEFSGVQIEASAIKPEGLPVLIATIERLRKPEDAVRPQTGDTFLPVELEILARIGTAACPYFVQLSDRKYVKVVNQGDPFGAQDRERFLRKELGSLWIRTADCGSLVSAIARSVVQAGRLAADLSTPESIQKLAEHVVDRGVKEDLLTVAELLKRSKQGKLRPEQSLESGVALHENLRKHIRELGFSDEVQLQAKATAQFAMEMMASVKAFKPILERMLREPASYLSGHSVYLAHLSVAICMTMPWDSASNREKLALAALLHDTMLEDERLARVRSLAGEAHAVPLTAGEIEQIREHPARAAEFLKSADPMVYQNVSSLVLHHHDRPDGKGFPSKIHPSTIPPLTALFIVAHDLVDFLYAQGKEASLVDFLVLHEEEYQVGQFKKIAAALDSMAKAKL